MNLPLRLEGATLDARGSAVAVTPHYLATDAAVTVLRSGGNAADAAIAANATLGVVAPETCGIGGDLFALVHTPDRPAPAALNASGRAGAGADAEAVRRAGHRRIAVDSELAVTVPGCVDGWVALAEEFGSMPLGKTLQTAIAHAREGFPATPELSQSLDRLADHLRPQPASRGLFPNDLPPAIGALVTRPALAETLAMIAADGRDGFYTGPAAAAITAATSGILAPKDIAQEQAEWVQPASLQVMGWTGWTIPPNSQGYLALAAAWLFEQLDPARDPNDPAFVHGAIEACRAVAWERDDLVADPDHAPLSAAALLDPERLGARLERLSLSARTEWPAPQPAPGGTAYLTVYDSAGMGVSLIQSNFHGIGSRIGAGEAGFFLHDRGSGFSLVPGHPNELAPGKRPLHTLSPTLWTEGEELRLLLGTRGGDFQPQTMLQMLTMLRWAGLDGAEAHRQPRWTTAEWREPTDTVLVEPHMDPAVVAALRSLGHEVAVTDKWMGGWGPVSVIAVHADGAVGAADPRVASTSASSM